MQSHGYEIEESYLCVFLLSKFRKERIIMKQINGQKTNEIEISRLGKHIGEELHLKGYVYKIRNMSDFSFVIIRTKREMIQCIYSPEHCSFPIKELKENSSILFIGEVLKEERSKKGYEIRLKEITLLTAPAEEVPVVINNKKVDASLDTILDYRVITLRNEKEKAIFKIQEGILHGAREFLKKNQFTEIMTPKIVYQGAEGGANIFKLDYFGQEAYLAQSPQFYKQMMVGVYERVFEIGKVYRAEKHDTSRHLNEYIGLDFEMGFIESFYDIMEMEVAMLQSIMEYLKEHYTLELDLLSVNLPSVSDIPSITFMEAKELIAKTYKREIKDYYDFEPEEEKLLCQIIYEMTGKEFVFVTHYPTAKRPFYAMEDSDNKEYTLSFDLLFRGLEVTTGGQRIHNYNEQIQKMEARNMNPNEFESYLMLHKYGICPHGGLGIGVERLTMCLLNRQNVRETSLFPRDMKRLIP